MKTVKDDYQKINTFLGGLNQSEFGYLRLVTQHVSAIKQLIREHNISKKDFCEMFVIPESMYKKYTTGNFDYNMNDIAKLNANFISLEAEALVKKTPIVIAK